MLTEPAQHAILPRSEGLDAAHVRQNVMCAHNGSLLHAFYCDVWVMNCEVLVTT